MPGPLDETYRKADAINYDYGSYSVMASMSELNTKWSMEKLLSSLNGIHLQRALVHNGNMREWEITCVDSMFVLYKLTFDPSLSGAIPSGHRYMGRFDSYAKAVANIM